MKVSELGGQVVGGGRYKLLSRLGSGNFGTVYRAHELLNGSFVREAALKLYSPEATASGNVEGMLRDCTLPARILGSDAPIEVKRHFVQIYGFGTLDTPAGECAYVSMELVRGGTTLEKKIQRNKDLGILPQEDEIVDYMRQFFTALSASHSAGVLHRDIKGANVMLHNGVVRVMDFGMGAWADDPGAQLKTTMSIYAPENFEGRYTVASDLYQAGLMFLEFYTGVSPFADRFGSGDMAAEKEKRRTFVFRGGAAYPGANISRKVDNVLKGCLEYLEDMRFQSAQEVLAALETDDLKSGVRALKARDFGEAERVARALTEQPNQAEERRIQAHMLLSRALKGQERSDEALTEAKKALAIAEQSGLAVRESAAWNRIIDAITVLYLQSGQAGMARIYEKKKR